MKPTLCFYFQIHQPVRLRKYHFFDIGKRHDYFDEYINRSTIQRIAHECYLPMNNMLLELISKYGKNLKLSFSLSGSAIDQFEMHAPEVIESFKRLAETGCVEFIAETYGHSLASLSPTVGRAYVYLLFSSGGKDEYARVFQIPVDDAVYAYVMVQFMRIATEAPIP